MKEIACFITSHGFGHATRTAAVIEALSRQQRFIPRLFASTGESLFHPTLKRYIYHHRLTDIGFCQKDSFRIDWQKTAAELESLLPYSEATIGELVRMCRNCCYVLCDISALGIVVAARLGVPSVLIENFTWDWFYAVQQDPDRRLESFGQYLKSIYRLADIHIQTQPVCSPRSVDLCCAPIYRRARSPVVKVRQDLPGAGRKRVLITMGGLGFSSDFLEEMHALPEYFFLIAGQPQQYQPCENVLMLAQSDSFYHPDLIGGVDIVVFKSGYSTLAECRQAGTASICVQRQGFAESPVLEHYAQKHLGSHILSQDDFVSGRWLRTLPQLILQAPAPATVNGADQVADYLLQRSDLWGTTTLKTSPPHLEA